MMSSKGPVTLAGSALRSVSMRVAPGQRSLGHRRGEVDANAFAYEFLDTREDASGSAGKLLSALRCRIHSSDDLPDDLALDLPHESESLLGFEEFRTVLGGLGGAAMAVAVIVTSRVVRLGHGRPSR